MYTHAAISVQASNATYLIKQSLEYTALQKFGIT